MLGHGQQFAVTRNILEYNALGVQLRLSQLGTTRALCWTGRESSWPQGLQKQAFRIHREEGAL